MADRDFHVEPIDYASGVEDLRRVREVVFVQEQQVPLELEWDELDPQCRHVIARDRHGQPIGTGRLTPQRRIGRMAVLAAWRGRGVGDALLLALMQQARQLGWADVSLHAQVSAEGFYARHGFVPLGERFHEAGIEHQTMQRRFDGAVAIDDSRAAVAALTALLQQSRRSLFIYSRALDPGVLDATALLEGMRRFAQGRRGAVIQLLLQDADAPQRNLSPLLPLAQRLPSVFQFRQIQEPADMAYPSAYAVNDLGGYYFRPLGQRFEGEAEWDNPGKARHLRDVFQRFWERSRPCSEYRALGL
ncbi:GNAT family N-acetyltransferase [Pseudoxanthomonas dokdonensis]|uniref:Acetyltransferase n=1 Tax=Pseudoxanthomonas dokdonensis TaxID=344882 RepID=A0A0R0CZ61_9GAMM|nr:GNAT family N-acetyltransferase [Pseudoxanthomonas dokdonensis]KRG70659.1 acetyltransferase [Pseudoxanthomonas dokdonensis]